MEKKRGRESKRWGLAGSMATLVLPILVYAPFTLGGHCLGFEDGRVNMIPMLDFFSEWLRQGIVPLWFPHWFSGMSFVSCPGGPLFYPGNYAVALMPSDRFLVWSNVLHCGLGGLGMRMLLRAWNVEIRVALVVGILFALSSPFYVDFERYQIPQILALLPWTLWAVERSFTETRYLPLASSLITLQVYAAFFQSAYLNLLILGIVSLTYWFPLYGLRSTFVRLVSLGILSLLASMVLLWPLMVSLSRDVRGLAGKAYFQVQGLNWASLVELFVPEFASREGLLVFSVPILVLVVGSWGLFAGGEFPRLRVLGAVLLVSGALLAVANGTFLEDILDKVVPFYGDFRYRTRYLVLAHIGLLLLITGTLAALLKGGKSRAFWVLSLLLVIDSSWAAGRFHKPFSHKDYYDLTPYQLLQEEEPEFGRFLSLPHLPRKFWNWGGFVGKANLTGFLSTSDRDYQDVLHWAAFGELTNSENVQALLNRNLIRLQMPFDAPILRILALSHIIYSEPPEYFYRVFRREDGVPHAFLVKGWRVVETRVAAFELLNDRRFDPTQWALMEKPLLNVPPDSPGEGEAVVEQPTPNELRVEVDWKGQAPTLLVLSELNQPGWRATVDGEPVEVHTAHTILRAVAVPPGRHSVVFYYLPPGWYGLCGLALAVWVGCGGWFFFAYWRGRAR